MSNEDLIREAHEKFTRNLSKNFYDAHSSSNRLMVSLSQIFTQAD